VPILRAVGEDRTTKAILLSATPVTTHHARADDEISPDGGLTRRRNWSTLCRRQPRFFITGLRRQMRIPIHAAASHWRTRTAFNSLGAVARVLSEPMLAVQWPRSRRPLIAWTYRRQDTRQAYLRGQLLRKPRPRSATPSGFSTASPAASAGHELSRAVQVLRLRQFVTPSPLSGEVVADYSYRLKRELPDERLWNAGYCNNVFATCPPMAHSHEGGYEADASSSTTDCPPASPGHREHARP